MHDLPRQKLKFIIARYGVVLHNNPQRCEAFLRDFCGQFRKEISLLINTQKEKIPAELLNSQNSSLPVSLTIARLSKRLEDNLAITSEAAKWSVESWALALNLITEAETLIDGGKLKEAKVVDTNESKQEERNATKEQQSKQFNPIKQAFSLGVSLAHNAQSLVNNTIQDQGKLEEAKDEYQQTIHFDPNYSRVKARIDLGNVLYNQGKLEEAKYEYQQAIRLDPNYAIAHNNLGLVLFNQGKLEEAKYEYQQAIRLDPNDAYPHNNLGNVLFNQGKLEEAKAQYQQAIRLDPNYAKAHNGLGLVLQNQGKLEEAKVEYQQAIRLDPNDANAHNGLGVVLQNQGKLEEAKAQYQQAIRLDPNYAIARNNLALVLQNQGKLTESPFINKDLRTTKGIDYSRLDFLLAAQQWKEAELETCMLLAKASESASVNGWGYLYCSFQDVPCEELSKVDQLWISHSGGKFGFSVQRKIFDNLNQDLGAFARQVGWKGSRGLFCGVFSWKMKMQLTYDISAPPGHLPAVVIKGDSTGLDVILPWRALYSRLRACGL